MASLTDQQRKQLREFLTGRGLTFAPLLDELSDHLACDIEERMNGGLSYDEAWRQAISELPEDHFTSIQKETMETINKRFNLSKLFTYVALATLILGTVFKTLHLQGTSQIVFVSFVSMAGALVVSSVSGFYFNRQKNGAINILGLVAGTVLMIIGYGFRIFHLPGADQVILIAVVTTLVFMISNTAYLYRNTVGDDNLFIYLHEKHTPGIERFLLLLLMPMTIWIAGLPDFFVPMVLIVAIYGAGLQFIALSWRIVGKDVRQKNLFTLVLLVLSFISMVLPMMGEMLPFWFRLTLVTLFSFFAAVLSFRLESTAGATSYFVYIVPVTFILLALGRIGWIQFGLNLPMNALIAIILALALFLSPRYTITRAFLIMSLAAYLLEVMVLNR